MKKLDLMDKKWLAELQAKNPSFYERKIKILGLIDTDISFQKMFSRTKKTIDEKPDYWMGGKPYSGKKPSGILEKDNTKKPIVYTYVDGENISYSKAKCIIDQLKMAEYELQPIAVYILDSQKFTKGWKQKKSEFTIKKISGGPQKNKIDNIIKKEIRDKIQTDAKDKTFCIVTSDGGFQDIVGELRMKQIKVIGIGEEKAPKQLRNSYDIFYEI